MKASATDKVLRLRRSTDNTVYAYMCLNCGGAWKVYQKPICYCGAVYGYVKPSREVEGPWRRVKWKFKVEA